MADVKELNINNTTYDIKAKTIVDQNGGAIKTWTGTKAQYDAIATKDANTLYNITDDTDVTLALLELLFPVGAVYFGTMATCPLQTLGVGTWQALPPDKVIQIAGTRGSVGDTLNESLPNPSHTHTRGDMNITGGLRNQGLKAAGESYTWGAFYYSQDSGKLSYALTDGTIRPGYAFDASRSWTGSTSQPNGLPNVYQDNAPVQQDAYLLNGWRRIA